MRTKPDDINLNHFIMPRETDDRLRQDGAYPSIRGGLPFTDSDPIRDPREEPPTAHVCCCDTFKLVDEKERARYADLRALLCTDEAQLIWEERLHDVAGGIIVYITYIKYRYLDKQILKRLEPKNE